MKRRYLILLVLLLVLLFCGCNPARSAFYTLQDGTCVKIDTYDRTIINGEDIYRYTISGQNINITYPNGADYWYGRSGQMGSAGWSDDYDENSYIPGDTLVQVIQNMHDPKPVIQPGNIVICLIFVGLGVLSLAVPNFVWFISWGWRFKDAEPSDIVLFRERIVGIISIVIGVIFLFIEL